MNDELRHYGVKGMRWGVRRTPEQLGHITNAGVSGGHVMSYEIIDNKPVIYDSQNNRVYTSSDNVCEYFSSMENNFIVNAGYTRLDNATLNITSMYDWVEDNSYTLNHGEDYANELYHAWLRQRLSRR